MKMPRIALRRSVAADEVLAPPHPNEAPADIQLLTEIRDLLKK